MNTTPGATTRSTAAVKAWINENFIPGSVTVTPWPLLPGGTIIRDKEGGEMLVFLDMMTGKVKWMLPGEKRKRAV